MDWSNSSCVASYNIMSKNATIATSYMNQVADANYRHTEALSSSSASSSSPDSLGSNFSYMTLFDRNFCFFTAGSTASSKSMSSSSIKRQRVFMTLGCTVSSLIR